MLILAKPQGDRTRETDGGELREMFEQNIEASRFAGLAKSQVSS